MARSFPPGRYWPQLYSPAAAAVQANAVPVNYMLTPEGEAALDHDLAVDEAEAEAG